MAQPLHSQYVAGVGLPVGALVAAYKASILADNQLVGCSAEDGYKAFKRFNSKHPLTALEQQHIAQHRHNGKERAFVSTWHGYNAVRRVVLAAYPGNDACTAVPRACRMCMHAE